MVGFAFSSAHPSFCYYLLPYHSIVPDAKLFYFKLGGPLWGLQFILPLMAQQGHWFLCYIVSGLSCPICFPLGFLGPFPIFALPWAITEFFRLSWPNYIIPHPQGSWACHQPLTFFAFITLGLSQPILIFPHHILPMVCFFLSFQTPLSPFTSSRPICLSHGPVIHYSCRLGLMGFLSVCQLLSVRVAGLLLPTWASKMALNNYLNNNCSSGSSPKNMVSQKIINSRFSYLFLHFLSIQTSKNTYKTMIKLRFSNTIN